MPSPCATVRAASTRPVSTVRQRRPARERPGELRRSPSFDARCRRRFRFRQASFGFTATRDTNRLRRTMLVRRPRNRVSRGNAAIRAGVTVWEFLFTFAADVEVGGRGAFHLPGNLRNRTLVSFHGPTSRHRLPHRAQTAYEPAGPRRPSRPEDGPRRALRPDRAHGLRPARQHRHGRCARTTSRCSRATGPTGGATSTACWRGTVACSSTGPTTPASSPSAGSGTGSTASGAWGRGCAATLGSPSGSARTPAGSSRASCAMSATTAPPCRGTSAAATAGAPAHGGAGLRPRPRSNISGGRANSASRAARTSRRSTISPSGSSPTAGAAIRRTATRPCRLGLRFRARPPRRRDPWRDRGVLGRGLAGRGLGLGPGQRSPPANRPGRTRRGRQAAPVARLAAPRGPRRRPAGTAVPAPRPEPVRPSRARPRPGLAPLRLRLPLRGLRSEAQAQVTATTSCP